MAITIEPKTGNAGKICLADLTVRMVTEDAEKDEWNQLVIEHHYLHDSTLTGPQVRYVVECYGRTVALLSFSSPAYHLAARDLWIGWSRPQMAQRRHFIVSNSRFLILPGVSTPNLASKSLSLAMNRLSADWQTFFGHPVLLVETFTEKRFPGTSYKADNWRRLGATQGFSRDAGAFYIRNGMPKTIWVKELRQGAAQLLAAEKLPAELEKFEREMTPTILGKELTQPVLRSLYEFLASTVDPRNKSGLSQRLGGCLSLIVIGFLCGCEGLAGCAEFGKNLRQTQLKALGVRLDKKTRLYRAPCHSTLWLVMNKIDPADLASRISAWVAAKDGTMPKCIAIDGKTLRGSVDQDGNAMHVITAVNHDGDTPFLPRRRRTARGEKAKPCATSLPNSRISKVAC